MVIEPARRRWRERRARRLLDRARSHEPAALDGIVPTLRGIVATDDGGARFRAVEALAAVARSGQAHPVRSRATDALVELLAEGSDPVRAAVSPEVRYVALERPAVVPRIDEPFAAVLTDGGHAPRSRVATDAGILVAEGDAGDDLPATMGALEELLVGGDPAARRAAVRAYLLVAGSPSAVPNPGTVAEHLAILGGELDEPLVGADAHLRHLADGRTLADAAAAFAAADREL